jgi:hypothetical protein
MKSWTKQNIELLEHLSARAVLTATLDRAIRAYRLSRKYSPDQPRVPAGSTEGGQWTSGGAESPSRTREESSKPIRLADASDVLSSRVMSDASPDPIRPGAQYAQVAVERVDRTGNPQIDQTTDKLMQALARAHDSVGEGAGPVYGIMVHGAFGRDVKGQNLPGISVEQSFSLGDVAKYGLDGSIRTDVVLRDPDSPIGRPIAIWDVKTGGARLDGPRIREIRDQVGVGREVPVIKLHIGQGVTIKAHATISARLWNECFPDNADREGAHSTHGILL